MLKQLQVRNLNGSTFNESNKESSRSFGVLVVIWVLWNLETEFSSLLWLRIRTGVFLSGLHYVLHSHVGFRNVHKEK